MIKIVSGCIYNAQIQDLTYAANPPCRIIIPHPPPPMKTDTNLIVPGWTQPTTCLASPKVLASIRKELKEGHILSTADARLARNMGLISIPSVGGSGFNDGVIYPPDDVPAMAAAPSSVRGLRPVLSLSAPVGKLRALALLVDFPDNKGTTPKAHFEKLLFDSANPDSIRSYYKDISYKRLDVEGEVTDWIQAPKPYSYYTNGASGMGADPRNARELLKDILNIYCRSKSLAPFDLNGDGFVDGLFMIHAGAGAETESDTAKRKNMIWSHKWVLSTPFKNNGIKAYAYFTAPEDGRLGVFSHEFGHFLGLPDLYDTSYRSHGLGNWCLMAGGSWNGSGNQPARLSAWCLQQLGWIKPTNLKTAASLTLDTLANDPAACYRLWTSGKTSPEYFLIENRQKKGRDAKLPGSGLAVWHIDERQADNTNPLSYRVALVQADGRRDLEFNKNQGDGGDLFPGSAKVTKLNDSTSVHPHTQANSGSKTGVSLTAIVHSGGIITLNAKV